MKTPNKENKRGDKRAVPSLIPRSDYKHLVTDRKIQLSPWPPAGVRKVSCKTATYRYYGSDIKVCLKNNIGGVKRDKLTYRKVPVVKWKFAGFLISVFQEEQGPTFFRSPENYVVIVPLMRSGSKIRVRER